MDSVSLALVLLMVSLIRKPTKIGWNFIHTAPRSYSSAAAGVSYDGPSVKTAIPGPKSKALLGELNKFQVILSFVSNSNRKNRMWADEWRQEHLTSAIKHMRSSSHIQTSSSALAVLGKTVPLHLTD